ncbi:MAG: LptF/LptG family permease [Myxococcota bacterium]
MRAPRTLVIYVSREITVYGFLAFLAITAILVSQNLLRRLDDLVVVGFSGGDLWTLMGFLVSMLMVYATPIGFLFGVSLAISRLSGDSEVLGMRASGVGMGTLLVGPLCLAAAVSVLTGYLMIEVEPSSQRSLRTMLKSVAARGGVLEAGKFRDIMGRVIFVEDRDHDNRLRGIMIEDRSDKERPFLIFAEEGHFVFDDEAEAIRIELDNGEIHLEPSSREPEHYRQVEFRELSYRFSVGSIVSGAAAQVRPREMGIRELRENIALLRAGGEKPDHLREGDPVEYELQLHRRFAIPVAPILFALIAVPLGLRRVGATRSWGALIALVIVFLYYSLMTFGQFLAREGWVGPGTALWLPNLLNGGVAAVLLARTRGGSTL